MQVRQIALINDQGERLDLLLRSSFFNDISGYGFGMEQNFLPQGEAFYAMTKNETEQSVISGRLSFIDRETAYADYRTFTQWLSATEKLTMAYKPYGDEEYLKDVTVESLSKGELDIGGYLGCDITFRGLTPWYSLENMSFLFNDAGQEGNEKRYTYRYSYKYGVSRRKGAVEFSIDGDFDAGIYVVIVGPVQSPVLSIRVNGEIKGRLAFTGLSLAQGQSLIYSTVPNNTGVWIQEDGELTDIIDIVEMHQGTPSFFKAQRNANIMVQLETAGQTTAQVGSYIQLHQYWRTV